MFFSQLRDKFVNIRSKLSELSNCQAIILGNQYDLQYVTEILHAIDRRLELWKYCDVSSHTIREWLQTVFKKVINASFEFRFFLQTSHTVYLDGHMYFGNLDNRTTQLTMIAYTVHETLHSISIDSLKSQKIRK